MNSYAQRVLDELKVKNPGEKEFHQAATEIFESLSVVFDKHPEFEKQALLERISEPERTILFRVPGREELFVEQMYWLPEDLFEEGYTHEELSLMIGWDENIRNPVPERFIRSENVITAVCSGFVHWTLAFGEMLGIKVSPHTFGV